MLKLFTFSSFFYFLHHVRMQTFVVAGFTFIEICAVVAMVSSSIYRSRATHVAFVVLMYGNQGVELLNNIVFVANPSRFSWKTFRLVQKLALADSAFTIQRRSKAGHWLLAGSCIDSVSEIAGSCSDICFFYLVFAVKIITKVVYVCLFVNG